MKKKLISSGLAAISLILGTVITKPIEARPSQHTFSCVNVNGVPTTVAKRGKQQINMINWSKNDGYFGADWTPQKRCELVSANFQKYAQEGKLNYLTYGYKDGYPTICVAQTQSGSCTGQLYTLRKGDNPQEKVRRLFDRNGIANNPLLESGDPVYINVQKNDQVYIDINIYLTEAEASLSEDNRVFWGAE